MMDIELNLLVNELYKIIANIRECRRYNKFDLTGNIGKILQQLNNSVYNIQRLNYKSPLYAYEYIDVTIDILQSSEWISSGLWSTVLTALTNILKRPAAGGIIDRSFSELLKIDIISHENKLEGAASHYLSSITQILSVNTSNHITPDTICQGFLKLFHLSLQNKHGVIRLQALNTFTLFITKHHIHYYQIPLLLSIITSLDWLTAVRNEPNEKRLHITCINTLESLKINEFDYHNVINLYSANLSTLASLSKCNIPTTPSVSFLDRLAALVLAALNSINEFLELFIRDNDNNDNLDSCSGICDATSRVKVKQSIKYVLKNHLSFSLFISFLWDNENIIDASIRAMFNMYKIFGMEMAKQLELLISQLFSNPLNANKEYNAYLMRRIFLAISAKDLYIYMDALPDRHNTYQALVKLLLANSIPEIKVDNRNVNNINKRKNVFSQNRTKSRDRSARSDDGNAVVEVVSSDSLSFTLSAVSALLSSFSINSKVDGDQYGKNDAITISDLVDLFNNNQEWLKYFNNDEKQIVQFLKSPFLDLKKVGEFLGSHTNPVFMDKVRREFVAQFNFTAMPIVTALRMFLSTFRLPGESQQIERIIDSFAEAYYSDQLQKIDNINNNNNNDNKLTLFRWVVQEDVYYDTFKNEFFLAALRAFYDVVDDDADINRKGTTGGNFSTNKATSGNCTTSDSAGIVTMQSGITSPNTTIIACMDIVGPYVWRKSFESNLGAWFANADAVFVLCYSIIMLNTDLHNSQIKNKMKLEEFVRNNKGINAGGDLPEPFLYDIYKSISQSQIQLYKDYSSSIQPNKNSFNSNYTGRKIDILQLPLSQYRQFWNKINEEVDCNTVAHNLTLYTESICLNILIKTGVLDFLDAAVYLSSSAQFLQDVLAVLWKLSVIAERIGSVEVINEIFILPSLAFTDQLSHRCQILIAFSLHYIAAFGRLFDSRSWEVAYSVILSLLSLNLLHYSPFGIPNPTIQSNMALLPPKVKFHKVDLKRQGFKWISDIAGYIFSNKHTSESASMLNDELSSPRFAKEALESASGYFLFSPQNKDYFIVTPLFDPLLNPSEIQLIKSNEDEVNLRHLLDLFYQYGPTNPSSYKTSGKTSDLDKLPIASMVNIATLVDTSIPQLLDYYKFRLALINHYRAHLLLPVALASPKCELAQFNIGLNEIERWLFGQLPKPTQLITQSSITQSGISKSSGRRFEREEEESERCKRGVILAPNDKDVGKFRIKASPLVSLATLGMVMNIISTSTMADEGGKAIESGKAIEGGKASPNQVILVDLQKDLSLLSYKLCGIMGLFSKAVHSLFDQELIEMPDDKPVENPTNDDEDDDDESVHQEYDGISALNWIPHDELDNIKSSVVIIILDIITNSIGSTNAKLAKFCEDLLHLVSRLPCKYLSPYWIKISIHKAIAAVTNSSGNMGILPTLLLMQRICGLGELTIAHRHDRRSCIPEEYSTWNIFRKLIAKLADVDKRKYMAEIVQTIITIAIFYQKCPINDNMQEEDYVDQVDAIRLLISLQDNGIFTGDKTIVMRSLGLISSFAPKSVRTFAMINLQQYFSRDNNISDSSNSRESNSRESNSRESNLPDKSNTGDKSISHVNGNSPESNSRESNSPESNLRESNLQVNGNSLEASNVEKGDLREGNLREGNNSVTDFFSVLNSVIIPLVTYRWTYKDTYMVDDVEGKLPIFHEYLSASISPEAITNILPAESIAARMASSFSTLCQAFMSAIPLLLQHHEVAPITIDSSNNTIEEMAKCGDNCIGYLLLAIRMVLRSLAEPASKIMRGKGAETFTEAIKNLIFVIICTEEIKKAPETCIKHAHGYQLLDTCAESAGVADKVANAKHSEKAVLATIANSIAEAQELQDIFIGIIQTIYA